MFKRRLFQSLILPFRQQVVPPLIAALLVTMVVLPDGYARGLRWPKYDGETLFRGLILGDGPAAKEFPEIWENADVKRFMAAVERENKANPKRADDARAEVMSRLRQRDATFFTNFGIEMQSGDHLRIQTTLHNTATILQELAQPADDANAARSSAMQTEDDPPGGDPGGDCAALAVIAVVALALAVAVAVALWLWAWIWLPVLEPQGRASSQLQTDVLVDLIATRLGPAH